MMIDDEKNFEWVSVSTAAKRLGLTTQMVYVRIREGKMLDVKEFERGRMPGYLVKMPRQVNK